MKRLTVCVKTEFCFTPGIATIIHRSWCSKHNLFALWVQSGFYRLRQRAPCMEKPWVPACDVNMPVMH